ncbi:MAG: DNA polymerase III subunit beta [Victivallales bacterium]|jgi:DNA polymerase-3 subunit beta|nr:DNA polymerase III subunit beta [Victivallales bacterium]MBT7161879.1 DNA polymerase III subunit beta [Victivallales bacterium]MBT7300105.1 DNA polymerase III subunit beta [Victivallales bacterium]
MKVTVSRDNLRIGMSRVSPFVGSRTTLPILNNVLLVADGESLSLSTTDLEVAIRTTIPAFVEQAGSTTLPAKKLQSIIGALPEGDVTLTMDENNQTQIQCGRSSFKILGLDPQDFPEDKEFDEEWAFSMPAIDLKKCLAKVAYSRSSDESRHVLNGVLLSVREGMLSIAATDGRRLALIERSLEEEGAPDGDVILPSKIVSELSKLLGGQEKVGVKLSQARAVFECTDTVISSKLVEGSYPNYRQVIPQSFAHSVAIPRVTFEHVLGRVALVVSDSSASVMMALENGNMSISASSAEVGEAEEPMDVSYEGDRFELSFNPDFFRDPLRELECDQLIMQFNDGFSPVALAGDEGFIYVVMPMRD